MSPPVSATLESSAWPQLGFVLTQTWSGSFRKRMRWVCHQRACSVICILTLFQSGLASVATRQASPQPAVWVKMPQQTKR